MKDKKPTDEPVETTTEDQTEENPLTNCFGDVHSYTEKFKQIDNIDRCPYESNLFDDLEQEIDSFTAVNDLVGQVEDLHGIDADDLCSLLNGIRRRLEKDINDFYDENYFYMFFPPLPPVLNGCMDNLERELSIDYEKEIMNFDGTIDLMLKHLNDRKNNLLKYKKRIKQIAKIKGISLIMDKEGSNNE
ncbi:MAG: hypothetical protein ACUZ8E_11590 [Candidatus Anammoxibacter sp.]